MASVDSDLGDSEDVDSHGCMPDLGLDAVAATEALADAVVSATVDAAATAHSVTAAMAHSAAADTEMQATLTTAHLVIATTAHKLDIKAATVDLVPLLASTAEADSARLLAATVAFAMEAPHALPTQGQESARLLKVQVQL